MECCCGRSHKDARTIEKHQLSWSQNYDHSQEIGIFQNLANSGVDFSTSDLENFKFFSHSLNSEIQSSSSEDLNLECSEILSDCSNLNLTAFEILIKTETIHSNINLNLPIYFNSECTIGQFIYIMLRDSITHRLSKSVFEDKLKQFYILLPQPNLILDTFYKFQNLFSHYKNNMRKIDICLNEDYLWSEMDDSQQCPHCGNNRYKEKNTPYKFIYVMSFINFLKDKLKNKDFVTMIRESKKNFAKIVPLVGHKIFKIIEDYPQFKEEYTTFWGFCTDGLAPFKSSQYQIWPVFLNCLNLPQKAKNNILNIPMVAIWPEKTPLNMNLLLLNLVEEFEKLLNGINCDIINEGKRTIYKSLECKIKMGNFAFKNSNIKKF